MPDVPGSEPLAKLFDASIKVSTGSAWDDFRTEYDLDDKYSQTVKDALGDSFLVGGIGASFIPSDGSSLQEVAQRLGYDHFNWLQLYTESSDSQVIPNILDPAFGCYQTLANLTGNACPNEDNLPWYNDEQFTNEGVRVYLPNGSRVDSNPADETRLQAWTPDPLTSLFSDDPTDTIRVITCLAGVTQDGTGAVIEDIVKGTDGTCFSWHTIPAVVDNAFVSTADVGGGLNPFDIIFNRFYRLPILQTSRRALYNKTVSMCRMCRTQLRNRLR